MKRTVLFFSVALVFIAGPLYAENFTIDTENTVITFSVKHMVISSVEGKFEKFAGGFEFDEKKQVLKKADLTIKAASLNTYHTHRDYELRSARFLNVVKYPEIKFSLNGFRPQEGSRMTVTGDITIRGITKSVALTGEYLGSIIDPMGNRRVGFSAQGTLDRRDFNIIWNKLLDTGEIVVGNKVEIKLEIQGIRKP